MRYVMLLLFGIHLASAGTHSLLYFCTGVSGDIQISELTSVGMVDGQQFLYFDSNTMKVVPKTEWMKQNEGEDHWNSRTENAIVRYKEYKNNMDNIMNLFNHSLSDVHTLQMIYGCELDDDGTSRGYLQVGYDGEDFISFDKNTRTWTAANPQAIILKNKWEANRAEVIFLKAHLEDTCIEWTKKYVSYSKDSMERKVAPEVSLLQKNSSSPVICHATGFYPKNITMTWKKNHEDHNEDVIVSETLPNADGTFQKSISLSVKSEEWKKNPDVYRCEIQHVGAEKEIVVTLNENNIRSNPASDSLIVKCLVSVIVAVIVGCVLALTVFAVKKKLIVCKKSTEVKSQSSTAYVKDNSTEKMFYSDLRV